MLIGDLLINIKLGLHDTFVIDVPHRSVWSVYYMYIYISFSVVVFLYIIYFVCLSAIMLIHVFIVSSGAS